MAVNRWAGAKGRKLYTGHSAKNPFFNRSKTSQSVSLKFKLIALFSILLMVGLVWAMFFSNLFLITSVQVIGAGQEKKNINDLAAEQLKDTRWLFFPQNNLIVFDKNRLAGRLNSDFILDRLEIRKKLFHRLIIDLKEKDYSFIWREEDKYYFIDNTGAILKEADPLQLNAEKTTIIDNQTVSLAGSRNIAKETLRIGYIDELNQALRKQNTLPIEYFALTSDFHTVSLKIASSGPVVLFNTETDSSSQLERLALLIKEKLKDNFLKQKYIDLRFGELVYYQ